MCQNPINCGFKAYFAILHRKRYVLVGLELFSQNDMFGDKHQPVAAVYGKNDQKHDFTHVYSKCGKIP